MKKIVIVLALASTSCLIPPPDADRIDAETTAEAADALDTVSFAAPADAAAAEALAGLPRWHAYMRGADGLQLDHPDDVDRVGQVVAIREGDENNPHKWVILNLSTHWWMGDRYFDELRKAGVVTATDLLMIGSDLLRNGAHLPAVPGQKTKRSAYGCIECGPSPSNPFPGIFGDDHRGGPVLGHGSSHPPPSKPGWAPGVKPPVPHPRPRPRPPTDAERAYWQAYANGVRRGDPEPVPFPGDEGYTPAPHEEKETFKCEGRVYHGYKGACIDFQAGADGVKWDKKIAGWSERYFNPNNIALTHEGWTTICKVASVIVGFTGCFAAVAGCGSADAMTFGTVTIPCWLITNAICNGHWGAGTLVFERCGTLMGMK